MLSKGIGNSGGLSVRREPACEGESACRLPTKKNLTKSVAPVKT